MHEVWRKTDDARKNKLRKTCRDRQNDSGALGHERSGGASFYNSSSTTYIWPFASPFLAFEMVNAKLLRAIVLVFEMCKDAIGNHTAPQDPVEAAREESLAREVELFR